MQVEEYYEQIVSAPKPRRGVDVYKRQPYACWPGAQAARLPLLPVPRRMHHRPMLRLRVRRRRIP